MLFPFSNTSSNYIKFYCRPNLNPIQRERPNSTLKFNVMNLTDIVNNYYTILFG